MYDTLRMHDDLDVLVRHVKQVVCLDDLERLVGQRRAVYGDLATHAPRRMTERVTDAGTIETLPAPVAKRAAAGRQHEATDLRRGASGDALEDCAVLAVHGYQLSSARARRAGDERAAHHERFLVRERDTFPRPERGECRVQPRRPDHRVEHGRRVVVRRGLDEALGARPPAGSHPALRLHQPHE
jgi:hypothetical protein